MSSDSEKALLEYLIIVQDANYNNTVQSIILSLCYGIYGILFIHSCSALYPKIRSHTSSPALFSVLLLLFTTTTFYVAGRLSAFLSQASWTRRTDSNQPISERLIASDLLMIVPAKVSTFGQLLNFVLGDAIVVWRSYVICVSSTWRRAILIVLLLCNTVLGLGIAVFEVSTPSIGLYDNRSDVLARLEGIYSFVSFGVNFIATLFIAIKARRIIQTFGDIGRQSYRSPVLRVLLLLTEGGIFFCILQLINACLTVNNQEASYYPTDPFALAGASFSIFTVSYAAIYPSLVIMLVQKQHSVIEMTVVDCVSNGNPADMEKRKFPHMEKRKFPHAHKLEVERRPISTIRFEIGSRAGSAGGGSGECMSGVQSENTERDESLQI